MSTLSQFSGQAGYGAPGDWVPIYAGEFGDLWNPQMGSREYLRTGIVKPYNNTYLTCVTNHPQTGFYNVSANGFDVTWYTPTPTYVCFKMERAGPYLHFINLHNSGVNNMNVKLGLTENAAATFTQANISNMHFATDTLTFQNCAFISGRDTAVSGGENMTVYRAGPPTGNTGYIRVLQVADTFNTVGRFIMANSNTTIVAVRQQGLTNPGMGSNVYNSGMICTSTDGVNWTQRVPNLITSIGATLPGSNTSLFGRIRRFTWSPAINHFVYLMEDGSAFLSFDGYTLVPAWSIANAPVGLVGTYWNTNFGAPSWGDNFTDATAISTLTASSPNTTLFAIGNDNTDGANRLLRLTSGNNWQVINISNAQTTFSLKNMDGMFVQNKFHRYFNRLVWDGNRFYIFNQLGWVAYSNDEGVTWRLDYRCYDSVKNVATGTTWSIFNWNNMTAMAVPDLAGRHVVYAVGQVSNPPTPYNLTDGPQGTIALQNSPGTKLARATPDLIGYLVSLSFYGSYTPYLRLR